MPHTNISGMLPHGSDAYNKEKGTDAAKTIGSLSCFVVQMHQTQQYQQSTQREINAMVFVRRTMAENLAELPGLKEGQEIIKPMSDPIKSSGHLQA